MENTGAKKEENRSKEEGKRKETGEAELSGGTGRSFFFDLFIHMKKAATGGITQDNCSFSPNPDLIGFYKGTNHFQLSMFSDVL